jgi:hypothetical protein
MKLLKSRPGELASQAGRPPLSIDQIGMPRKLHRLNGGMMEDAQIMGAKKLPKR